jgi:hypothetical protein
VRQIYRERLSPSLRDLSVVFLVVAVPVFVLGELLVRIPRGEPLSWVGVLAFAVGAGAFAALVVGYSGWRANVGIDDATLSVPRWTTIRLADLRDVRLVRGRELWRARNRGRMLGGNVAPHYIGQGYVLTHGAKDTSTVVGTRRPEEFARALVEAEDTPEAVRALLRRSDPGDLAERPLGADRGLRKARKTS